MKRELIIEEQGEKAYAYLSQFLDTENNEVEVVKTTTAFNVLKIPSSKKGIINLNKINDIKKMNDFFKLVNQK